MSLNSEKIVYFDNAATSWPKPPQMQAAMVSYLGQVEASRPETSDLA